MSLNWECLLSPDTPHLQDWRPTKIGVISSFLVPLIPGTLLISKFGGFKVSPECSEDGINGLASSGSSKNGNGVGKFSSSVDPGTDVVVI